MNRQEAINILTGMYRIPVENGADEFASEINKAIDMAIEALQDDWIPVSERLPEQTGEYLVWAKWAVDEFPTHSILHYDADVEGFGEWEEYYHPDTLGFIGGEFEEYAIEITAWQPLPEPYKGGDTE